MKTKKNIQVLFIACAAFVSQSWAASFTESPMLAELVTAGELAPVTERLPVSPRLITFAADGLTEGKYGGDLNMLMGREKDVRMMVVYGYARLVCYDKNFTLVSDLLEDVQVEDSRIFTLRLRKGHRWSDGHPFTSEDFRYYWDDIANNPDLAPSGLETALLAHGKGPTFEVIDETTVRYTWESPNPFFLPALAGARPQYIYAPAHYLKQFHANYRDVAQLNAEAKAQGQGNWRKVHIRKFRPYKNNNPDLPSMQPWVNTTSAPSQRFVFERNPYFHRVDGTGRQLPYIDRVIFNIADGKLISAKTGAGESDLQARNLKFSDFTFLKESESRSGNVVRLWETTKGAHVALFPNLNTEDPVWRELVRDPRFRRALSLAIDRSEINQIVYFGLAKEGNNTVHEASTLSRPEYRTAWASFDLAKANRLLDEIGLTTRNDEQIRLLPDGRPLEIIVETAGEETEQTDILELVTSNWRKAGVKLFSKPMQREVFRNRIFSGQTVMSIWGGLENGLPTPDMSPAELAPTSQQQLQWPKWGQYVENKGATGEQVDLPEAIELSALNEQWLTVKSTKERTAIWQRMLEIHADQVYSIGIVAAVPQPVVLNKRLRNVPEKGVYNWEPGAHFGIYRPDKFWFEGS